MHRAGTAVQCYHTAANNLVCVSSAVGQNLNRLALKVVKTTNGGGGAVVVCKARVYIEGISNVSAEIDVLHEDNVTDCCAVNSALHRQVHLVFCAAWDGRDALDNSGAAQRVSVPANRLVLRVVGQTNQSAICAHKPQDKLRLLLPNHVSQTATGDVFCQDGQVTPYKPVSVQVERNLFDLLLPLLDKNGAGPGADRTHVRRAKGGLTKNIDVSWCDWLSASAARQGELSAACQNLQKAALNHVFDDIHLVGCNRNVNTLVVIRSRLMVLKIGSN